MKKTLIIPLLVVIALMLYVMPVAASSWEVKVTGGGLATAGIVEFSITASAKQDSQGVTGQMQYSRSGQTLADLSVHGRVNCIGVFDDGAVAVLAGPAKAQNDPAGQVSPGAWLVVEIREGGVGSGDRVRVRLMDEIAALATCGKSSGSFPGTIYDGNFNIRSTIPEPALELDEAAALYLEETRYAEITSPTEGSTVSGWVEFAATLYNDEENDGVQWAVRFGDCRPGGDNVIGNVDGMNYPYTWDGNSFSAGADTTGWDPGLYCFVFNPKEKTGEANIRETVTFMVGEPEEGEFCKIGWKPPVSLENHVVTVNATLPIKFYLADCEEKPIHGEGNPDLVVYFDGNGEEDSGDGVSFPLDVKRGAGGYLFIAHFKPGQAGQYRAVVSYMGGEWEQVFSVVDPGEGKGTSKFEEKVTGKDKPKSEDKVTGQDKEKPVKPEPEEKEKKPKGKPEDKPGKGPKKP